MRWPASRPCLISTTPARRAPVTTSTRSTLSSLLMRYTNVSRPTCTTAISGTTSAGRSGRNRRTSSSMPGRSAWSLLAKSPRTVTARVAGSMRASMVLTTPSKVRPGHATLVALTLSPTPRAASSTSGTWKSMCMCSMSSSVAMTVVGVTSEPGLTWRMPSTPANGARTRRSPMSACICITRASAASRIDFCVSSVALDTSRWEASSRWRLYNWSASWKVACACTSAASWACPRSVTIGAPAAMCWPLSKCTFSTISLTLAVTLIDSRALVVPSACRVSFHCVGCTTCAVTGTASPCRRAAASCLPAHPANTARLRPRARVGAIRASMNGPD